MTRPKKRRRLASAVSLSEARHIARTAQDSHSQASPRIWLDELPPEVCQRIALRVCGGVQDRDSLAPACTSPVQCRAVVASLDHRLFVDIDDEADASFVEWMHIFGNDVVSQIQSVAAAWGTSLFRSNREPHHGVVCPKPSTNLKRSIPETSRQAELCGPGLLSAPQDTALDRKRVERCCAGTISD